MSWSSILMILVLFAGVALAILVAYAIVLYNSLIQVKNNVEKAFKNIDILLLQRHDELPKLVDTCKGYMKHEGQILEKLTTLREHYARADTMDTKTGIENQLNQQYMILAGRWEAYPDLKAQEGFIQIQERIAGLEAAIADRREMLNDSINIYNIQIERFPHLLLARIFGYAKKTYLEVMEEKTQDVKIDLS